MMQSQRIPLATPQNGHCVKVDLARRDPPTAVATLPVATLALLTTAQVAKVLAVSERTVERLRRNNELRSVLVGRSRRYHPRDVDAYIERLRGG